MAPWVLCQTDAGVVSVSASAMNSNIISVDLVKGGALIDFDDGAAVLLTAEFLSAHRNDPDNEILLVEPVEDSHRR